jgi:hypothetical protein
MGSAGLVAAVVAGVVALIAGARRLISGRPIARAVIRDPAEHTTVDRKTGAVTSIQGAELTMPEAALRELWTPSQLERLARTYWRFLTRVTLGFIRVYYTDRERYVCLLLRRFVLLSFQAPEYLMDDRRGIVRWRIEKGVLVARQGHRGDGYRELDVRKLDGGPEGMARIHVEVEVANFYPSIAFGISQFVYKNTQSRIHVIVTHGFLRSLRRLDLAESRVGALVELTVDDVPDPAPEPQPEYVTD